MKEVEIILRNFEDALKKMPSGFLKKWADDGRSLDYENIVLFMKEHLPPEGRYRLTPSGESVHYEVNIPHSC